MRVEKSVFISYRRTNIYHARAIYQSLTARGYDAFMDYENIDSGAFERIILREIDARAHFLVVLTPSALERCADPNDMLRREIERAIDMQRNIVPLMFEPFRFDLVEEYLTGKLALLKEYNGLPIPDTYFDEAMDKLVNRFLNTPLELVLHPTPPANRAEVEQRQAEVAAAPAPTEEQLNAEQYFERGSARYKQGDYDGAIADYTEALCLNPQLAAAYNNRGWVRYNQRDYDSAIADYEAALRLNPQDAIAYNNRGIARYNQGDLNGAIADFNETLHLNPQYADAYNNRGIARRKQGDYDGAIADYEAALRLNPQLAEAYIGRGTRALIWAISTAQLRITSRRCDFSLIMNLLNGIWNGHS
jgi:tetratricopeptide (TPR) repeat protein